MEGARGHSTKARRPSHLCRRVGKSGEQEGFQCGGCLTVLPVTSFRESALRNGKIKCRACLTLEQRQYRASAGSHFAKLAATIRRRQQDAGDVDCALTGPQLKAIFTKWKFKCFLTGRCQEDQWNGRNGLTLIRITPELSLTQDNAVPVLRNLKVANDCLPLPLRGLALTTTVGSREPPSATQRQQQGPGERERAPPPPTAAAAGGGGSAPKGTAAPAPRAVASAARPPTNPPASHGGGGGALPPSALVRKGQRLRAAPPQEGPPLLPEPRFHPGTVSGAGGDASTSRRSTAASTRKLQYVLEQNLAASRRKLSEAHKRARVLPSTSPGEVVGPHPPPRL